MVKKITAGVIALVMVFGTGVLQTVNVLPETVITASAAEDKLIYESYEYKVLDNGTVEIVKYKGNDTELTIPAQIDGKKVTVIGSNAFNACFTLTDVTIPEGVTTIGLCAFANCRNMTSISIPDTVTTIGHMAFYTTGLTGLVIPDSVTKMDYGVCQYSEDLKTVKLGSGLTKITNNSFEGCASLTDITIGSSVNTIEAHAFGGCRSLKEITLPDSVTSIGMFAFVNCTSLKSVAIPASVKRIGAKAFGYYDGNYKKLDGFKIYCYKGTAGESYAVNNGFDYELLKPAYILGDVNGDGAIDIADVSQLMNHINGVKSLDEDAMVRADADGSKVVDVSDTAKIVNHINGVKSLY